MSVRPSRLKALEGNVINGSGNSEYCKREILNSQGFHRVVYFLLTQSVVGAQQEDFHMVIQEPGSLHNALCLPQDLLDLNVVYFTSVHAPLAKTQAHGRIGLQGSLGTWSSWELKRKGNRFGNSEPISFTE